MRSSSTLMVHLMVAEVQGTWALAGDVRHHRGRMDLDRIGQWGQRRGKTARAGRKQQARLLNVPSISITGATMAKNCEQHIDPRAAVGLLPS